MIRAFICLELSSSLKTRLEKLELELQTQTTSKVSWVKASNLHLTLRFLGDIAENQISKVQTCIEEACLGMKSFVLEASQLGAFPNLRRPRVFWVGIKDSTSTLLLMQEKLEQKLIRTGFSPSDHSFSPHLTIGRLKEGTGQDISAKFSQIEFTPESFLVKEIILMRSDLRPSGAIYSKLAVIKLAEKT